jgi:type I restriction enzyme S subunit
MFGAVLLRLQFHVSLVYSHGGREDKQMKRTREEAVRLVRKFHEELEALYGPRLRRVFLYGSCARGEADEDSDIDVAVVLEDPVNRAEERHRVAGQLSDFCLRERCFLIPFFVSETEFKTTPCAIHRSIVREGVPA